MALESINPANGKKIRSYREFSQRQILRILTQAEAAFQKWRHTPTALRAKKIRALAKKLVSSKERFARLMAAEMGKPFDQGISEIEKCAWVCDYYAAKAARFLAPEKISTDASKSFVVFEPLGVILAVMPWNFPFWQVFRAAIPALTAGNAVVLKHASNVMGCALAIENIFKEAGFPSGLFRSLLIGTQRVGFVIDHPAVKAVTLTGSTPAGRAVASRAGQQLKKTVLELGGSDPYLILEDADLELAVESCAHSRLINAGQSCIAAKRFIVAKRIQKKFEEMFVAEMRSRTLGPMARVDLRDALHRQVRKSVALGAKLLLGGRVPRQKGAYYPATVLTHIRKGMPAYDEELFGPVASIIGARNETEAIRLANDSIYGLGAAVFTRNRKRGERIAREKLEAGSCFVNAFVSSDPRLPFGGIKQSGYGRELSVFGIREFVNIKTVSIK